MQIVIALAVLAMLLVLFINESPTVRLLFGFVFALALVLLVRSGLGRVTLRK